MVVVFALLSGLCVGWIVGCYAGYNAAKDEKEKKFERALEEGWGKYNG